MQGTSPEIEQIKEVKPPPKECPAPPPCPVCPPKPKPWQICLKLLVLLLAGLVLAFIILAGSGLRIVRKESLLDVWLASRKTTPTPEVLEPTPTPDPTADWQTYTNSQYGYEIKYPPEMTEFQPQGSFYSDEIPHSFAVHNIPLGLGPDTVDNPDDVRVFAATFRRNTKGLTLEKFIKENLLMDKLVKVDLVEKRFGNLSGILYAMETSYGLARQEFAIEKDNFVIQFTGIDNEEGKKILSTFKFLD